MPKSDASNDNAEEDKGWKWDGCSERLDDFSKTIARWCRNRWGTTIGNHFWNNTLPDVETYKEGDEWAEHCSEIWDAINDMNPAKAKVLWDVSSGFYNQSWHKKWRREQYDRLFDKVEATVTGMAALEVEELGMKNAPQLKSHLHKQFGGAGDDIRAREENLEAGLPEAKGAVAFPPGVNMENKLRTLQAERIALLKMCSQDKRSTYEYGKESKLVKIVLRHLRQTEYRECVDKLLQEVKIRKEFESKLPVLNQETGVLELPEAGSAISLSEDWDFRNFSDDWLPNWMELKSKLVSHYKVRRFSKGFSVKTTDNRLPVMYVPGLGSRPTVRCFGCGEYGHRKGDEVCKAKADEWHESAPKHFQQRTKGPSKDGRNHTSRMDNETSKNVDGLKGRSRRKVCFEFEKTGRCRFGSNCRFEHPKRKARTKARVFLTKRQKTTITAAAVRTLKKELKDKLKSEEKGDDDNDLRDYMKSILCVWTIPQTPGNQSESRLPVFSTSQLVRMEDEVCYDSGSAMGISTSVNDFVYLDRSREAKDSVTLNGPSVGTPGCGGRGALVFRIELNGVPYGLVHPGGVLAVGDRVEFRLASERILKKKGVRVVNGAYDDADRLECVRSGRTVPLLSKNNLLVLRTTGKAKDIADTPEFRKQVQKIEDGVCSPLLDLTPFLRTTSGVAQKREYNHENQKESDLQSILLALKQTDSFKMKSVMTLNEARLQRDELSRLWCRRLGHVSTDIFPKMRSMPEYGDMPNLVVLNEDNRVGDLAKFKRQAFPKNDPEVTMNCPPWWRVYCDGYGGQKSLGTESYEGAIGAYVFACASTGSTDVKLYASHQQFPIALQQFLTRVEAEHFKCRCIYVDTHSVNLSEDAEEICALYSCLILPVSAGTPQEMAFAESRVKKIKQMSTALMVGAPHLSSDSWALADKYSVYVQDFLPQSTRNYHCPYYLRTGRKVPWSLLSIHPFGAPCIYAPIDGALHKRAPVAEEGFFCGIQWPAVLVRRKKDLKIISVSRKKVKVYESAYISPLDKTMPKVSFEPSHGDAEECVIQTPDISIRMDPLDEIVIRPELDKNRVQSIKSLREHTFQLPGRRERETSKIEQSAMLYSDQGGEEGDYVDPTMSPDPIAHLKSILNEAGPVARGLREPRIREVILRKIKEMGQDLATSNDRGQLKVGKRRKDGMSNENVIKGKRIRQKPPPTVTRNRLVKNKHEGTQQVRRDADKSNMRGRGRPQKIGKGDYVSIPASAFDGTEPGSFSDTHPSPVYGKVKSMRKDGLATVDWNDGDTTEARMKDLTLVHKKLTSAMIIVMLIEGEKMALGIKDSDKVPKDFFEVLVRSDWRKWVEAIKKELAGWENNRAVTVVKLSDVPSNAKIVPLGELYSKKRDGRYKYRQYLMGNLLREGIDYGETFSTTVSNSGICIFFSLATTCKKEVWGWDAVCGYLQSKEQHEVYAFLPSHHGYSELEYEQIAELRRHFLQLVQEEGEDGIRKFAKKHKKESRCNPKEVYKCNKSIYGAPSAGHEFEMLMHSVHTKGCGLTQTQPEPSLYVRIVVDEDDVVVGYIIVAIYVDDVRFFGTERERKKYIKDVQSKMKVTIESPPVSDFISIEIHQDLRTNTCELKMPRYFEKAAAAFKDYFPGGPKERLVPLTAYDEKLIKDEPSPEEIEKAKGLPYLQLLGVMTYPASNCKFEIKLSISKLGSRRNGWSKKHFEVVLRVFEYAYTTREIGVMYSKGLDPHGENTLWASADASLEVPRPYGCRIMMMNGGAVSFKAKRQTLTAPSTVWAELTEFSNASFDVCACRNLLQELGFVQQTPTPVQQDNEAAQRIINNRGSAGVTSRAMDLRVLSSRNRIEDHEIITVNTRSDEILADIGTKALMVGTFVRLRDLMNGYTIVKAAYPSKPMSKFVFERKGDTTLACVQAEIQSMRKVRSKT